MEHEDSLVGVRGWLLFLVLVLTVIGPALGAWNLISELKSLAAQDPSLVGTPEFVEVTEVSWFIWGIGTFLVFCAGLLLALRHKPSTVWIAICLLWLGGPILNGLVLLDQLMIGVAIETSQAIGIVRSIVPALVWSAYLLMSRRVSNTYRFRKITRESEAFS